MVAVAECACPPSCHRPRPGRAADGRHNNGHCWAVWMKPLATYRQPLSLTLSRSKIGFSW
jgi:hypothetical protein